MAKSAKKTKRSKKSSSKKSTTKKSSAKKPATKKSTTKKTSKKKSTAKKSTGKKSTAKKPAKKTTQKKTTTKKVTKKKSTKKRSTKKAGPDTSLSDKSIEELTGLADEPLTPEELRKVKPGLNKREIEKFRKLLLEKRAEMLGDVESLESDALRGENNGGNLSNMPMHMADVGSDNYEQEFTLGLVESEKKMLREIDEALVRMQEGIYGVCLESGKPIGKPRLEAKPWAKYCIEIAREKERQGAL